MNNMPYPYMPVPMPFLTPNQENYMEEINKLKYEIASLKERVKNLETKKEKGYLQKEDGYYIM